MCEVTSKDSVVKYRHRAIVLLGLFGQIKDLFSSIDLVHNRGFWQFAFHGVHFDNDAQSSFSADNTQLFTRSSLIGFNPPTPYHYGQFYLFSPN